MLVPEHFEDVHHRQAGFLSAATLGADDGKEMVEGRFVLGACRQSARQIDVG